MDYNQFQRSIERIEYRPSFGTTIAYAIAAIYIVHQTLIYFDFAILSPQELIWNALIYTIPQRLLLDCSRREELKAQGVRSQTHEAKSEALRKMLGFSGGGLLQSMPGEGLMRRASLFSKKPTTEAPPGLGNWDNSCYQNSVLQGLASLESLKTFLEKVDGKEKETSDSLLETVNKLNDPTNNGKQLWTPAKLKNMSSWQQQDAQEYYSKIVDELDKESAKAAAGSEVKPGLESIADEAGSSRPRPTSVPAKTNSPLDGMLAQRVACTRCGYTEGLSMIPFNCLTVPLGSRPSYRLEECLDEYAGLEEISDVECSKCTVVHAEKLLKQMLPSAPEIQANGDTPPADSKMLSLPPEIRAQAFKRLRAIQQALEEDDFSDKTINESCQISKKSRVSSTKTRQAVIGRPPQSLVIHVNRSVFDEMTGMQRKNYASVQYPMSLDLRAWMRSEKAGNGEPAQVRATESMLAKTDGEGQVGDEVRYRVKAVVTHYGRHENGHYICYRRHPKLPRNVDHGADDKNEESPAEVEDVGEEALVNAEAPGSEKQELQWWCLSDEDVSAVSEDEVFAQGGAFMLFYEREDASQQSATLEQAPISEINVDNQVDCTNVVPALAVDAEDDPTLLSIDEQANAHSNVPPDPSAPVATVASEQPATTSASRADVAGTHSTPANEPEDLTTQESMSSGSSSEHTQESQNASVLQSPPPPQMRTARGRQASRGSKDGKAFGGMGMRAVAAT